MTTAKILKHAETLDHDQRWQYMVELGRRSRQDVELAWALGQLAVSSVQYERMLASMSAHGSHDKAFIVRLMEDPSRPVVTAVIRLAAQHLDDDTLLGLVPRLPQSRRRFLFQALLAAGREEVNDRLFPALDTDEQKLVLPYTSEAFIRSHLDDEFVERLEIRQWRHLTQRFPALVHAILCKVLDARAELPWSMHQAVRMALLVMQRVDPVTGLALLERALDRVNPTNLCFDLYARHFPEAVAQMVLRYPVGLRFDLPLGTMRRLDPLTLCEVVEADVLADSDVFPRLLPGQRTAIYEARGEAWREEDGAVPVSHVRALPQSLRQAEARHALGLPLLQSHPLERARYLCALPYAESRPLAEPFLAQPDGEIRAQAVAALVKSGRYDVQALGDILDFCLKRENEQDPVRQAMIDALASLPPTRWLAPHLPKIKQIIDAAMRARDCSYQTMDACARLLLGMLVPQTDFVVAAMPALVERMGRLSVPLQESRITDAEMRRLAPHLMPLLESWVARDRSPLALGLISCFGRRARAVPEFTQLMIGLTNDKREHVARSGLETLVRLEFRKEVANLIPRLIEQDAGWIKIPTVANYLHRRRQSLLTPFLVPRVYKGRFSSGGKLVPRFDDGFLRWTANQQRIYAESMCGIIESEKRNAWELYRAIHRLGEMPSIDLAPLIHFARLDAQDAALRDKALEALGRADSGRGVPALIAALDDARDRVAIYALRAALLDMPVRSVLAQLLRVSSDKVTVVKEVIRLAGEFSGEDAYAFLSRYAATENLHPDAQIALLRAFWRHLDHEAVWERFHAAACSERAALARATIRIPQEGLSRDGRQRLCRHLALLLRHPDALVVRETLERLVAMPLGESDLALREALIALLENEDDEVCRLAAQALLAAYVIEQNDALVTAFADVRRTRSLVAIVDAYRRSTGVGIERLRKSARALAEALIVRRRQPAQAMRLAVMLLEPNDAAMLAQQIEASGLLHPGVVASALDVWNGVAVCFRQQELDAVEVGFRSATSPGLRRMGLGLLLDLAEHHGWTDERRAALTQYRQDREPWVSDAADLIEPPRKLEAGSSVAE